MKAGRSSIYPGVPDELLPLWTAWQLPSGSLERCTDRSALEQFAGTGLTLGIDARDREATPARLAQLEQLQYLVIDGQIIPPELLDAVGRLTGLRRLQLANVRVNDLSFVESLTELEYLAVDGLSGSPSLSPVARLPKLVSLGIGSACNDLDSVGDGGFPGTRCLLLRGNAEARLARFDTLRPLARLRTLEYLVFSHGRTQDRSLSALHELPRLQTVVLGSPRWWKPDDVATLETKGVRVEWML